MKTRNLFALLMAPAAAWAVSAPCAADTSATFIPADSSAPVRAEAKTSGDAIRILAGFPADRAVIIGELEVKADADTSIAHLMAAALREAATQGADFIALAKPAVQPDLVLGKMVPVGHGRSLFVAGPIEGSEVARMAALPGGSLSHLHVILGRYSDTRG
jgi:hypothetical protein